MVEGKAFIAYVKNAAGYQNLCAARCSQQFDHPINDAGRSKRRGEGSPFIAHGSHSDQFTTICPTLSRPTGCESTTLVAPPSPALPGRGPSETERVRIGVPVPRGTGR